ASPSASAADGVNEYEDPWLTLVAGVPEIVGARLPALTAAASSSAPPQAASEIPSATITDPRNSSRVRPIPESPPRSPWGRMATLVPCRETLGIPRPGARESRNGDTSNRRSSATNPLRFGHGGEKHGPAPSVNRDTVTSLTLPRAGASQRKRCAGRAHRTRGAPIRARRETETSDITGTRFRRSSRADARGSRRSRCASRRRRRSDIDTPTPCGVRLERASRDNARARSSLRNDRAHGRYADS